MQNLEVVPRLIPDIVSGMKRHTIRWKELKIVPGPMQYVNAENHEETVVVSVTAVKIMPLSSVSRYLGMTEEWPDDVLLNGMKEHYPEISLSDLVDVIHHLPPR